MCTSYPAPLTVALYGFFVRPDIPTYLYPVVFAARFSVRPSASAAASASAAVIGAASASASSASPSGPSVRATASAASSAVANWPR